MRAAALAITVSLLVGSSLATAPPGSETFRQPWGYYFRPNLTPYPNLRTPRLIHIPVRRMNPAYRVDHRGYGYVPFGPRHHYMGYGYHSGYRRGLPVTRYRHHYWLPYSQGIYRVYLSPPPRGGIFRANSSDLIFQVSPPQAQVYINEKLIGSAGDFATTRDRYMLLEGEYDLRIEMPGYRPFSTRLQVVADRTLHINMELEPAAKSSR